MIAGERAVVDHDRAVDHHGEHAGRFGEWIVEGVLVTDLVLPGINGYELAERALAASPGLRVLFVSGYAAPETMPPICGAAATHFLQKPYQPSRLAAAVAVLLAVGGPDPPSGESSRPDACRLGRRVAVDI